MAESIRGEQDGEVGWAHEIRGEWRFIADDPANAPGHRTQSPMSILPGAVHETLSAVNTGFGETIENTGLRFQAASDTLGQIGEENPVKTPAQIEFDEVQRLLAPLEESQPFATAIGQSIPGMLLPSSKVAQTFGGAAEGALADPDNPILGSVIGGTGAFLGGIAGQKLGTAILARGESAAARLAQRNIPTTLAQRTGSETEQALEAGLQAIPVLNQWVQAPARAQQRALNRGAQSVFGYEGALNKQGLGEVKAGMQKSFQEVQSAIPDQQLPSEMVERLDGFGVLDAADKEVMQGFGLADGELLMTVRSRLNENMADAFMSADRNTARQLQSQLKEVDDIIKAQLPGELASQWATTRQQWQFFTAIRKGKALNGAGDVNLASMNNALNSIYPNFRVGTDLPGSAQGFGELVNALDELPKALQSSGTAERTAAMGVLTGTGVVEPTALGVPALAAARAVGQPGVDIGATAIGGAARAAPVMQAIEDALPDFTAE